MDEIKKENKQPRKEVKTMLIVKYERKDFFGNRIYTEDTKNNETLKDIKKAFIFLKNNHDVTIQINNTVLYWDSLQNFEYKTLSAREYDSTGSYKEFIWDFDGCKNNYYKIYKAEKRINHTQVKKGETKQ